MKQLRERLEEKRSRHCRSGAALFAPCFGGRAGACSGPFLLLSHKMALWSSASATSTQTERFCDGVSGEVREVEGGGTFAPLRPFPPCQHLSCVQHLILHFNLLRAREDASASAISICQCAASSTVKCIFKHYQSWTPSQTRHCPRGYR